MDVLIYPLSHVSCPHKLCKVVKIFTLLLYWFIAIYYFSSFLNKIGSFSHLHIILLPILLFLNRYLWFGWLYFYTIHSLPIKIYHTNRQRVSSCLLHLGYPVDANVRICWNDWLFIKGTSLKVNPRKSASYLKLLRCTMILSFCMICSMV